MSMKDSTTTPGKDKKPRKASKRKRDDATFSAVVRAWAKERELLGFVQPYTARKAEQKALLFEPWIGSCDIAAIEPDTLTEALVRLGSEGGRKGCGLSSSTLRAAHLAATQAIDWAVGKGLASANPFNEVRRPKALYRPARFLTMGQASKLATKMADDMRQSMREGEVRNTSYALAGCIGIATGLRRGEVFALTWNDLDEQNLRISVSKAVKAGGEIGSPKSVSSIRSVAIGAGLLDLLAEARSWQQAAFCGDDCGSPDAIICGADGQRASLNAFEHWWRSWADENGWDGLRYHELRHTHATLLIANGVDVKTVQMRLGHSSADITMSVYAHAIPLSDGTAAAALDTSLFGR